MGKRILHWITYSIVGLFYALGMGGVLAGKLLYAIVKAILSLFIR